MQGAATLAIGLSEDKQAVAGPWSLTMQEIDQPERPLAADTSTIQVFDDSSQELLILGDPGSGKTTLLLQLARALIERAKADASLPIPVVFNLSSWSHRREPLDQWMTNELITKYQVPRQVAGQWILHDEILPLLDGLDEVALSVRNACAEAINSFRSAHGLFPIVVCSRREEYQALRQRIQVNSAVIIQPLTISQVDSYLEYAGTSLAPLRTALHDDASLRDLSSTPLMLSILTLAYHDRPVTDLYKNTSTAALREHIFSVYLEKMLHRRSITARYTSENTRRWLTWLARQMTQRSQTEFSIEQLQPDWVPDSGIVASLERRTWWVLSLAYGVLFAAASTLALFIVLLLLTRVPGNTTVLSAPRSVTGFNYNILFTVYNTQINLIAYFPYFLIGSIACGFVVGHTQEAHWRWFWHAVRQSSRRSVSLGLLVGVLYTLVLQLSLAQLQKSGLDFTAILSVTALGNKLAAHLNSREQVIFTAVSSLGCILVITLMFLLAGGLQLRPTVDKGGDEESEDTTQPTARFGGGRSVLVALFTRILIWA